MKTSRVLATLVVALVLIEVVSVSAALPPGWYERDIGEPSVPGSASYDQAADVWTITGSGSQLAVYRSDGAHYAYRHLTGDGQITARVINITPTVSAGHAGVMIREDLTPGCKQAFMSMRLSRENDQQADFTYRNPSSGGTFGGDWRMPTWVRLRREGDEITPYVSWNGVSWEQRADTRSVPMGSSVYVGLAVTTSSDEEQCTARFESVTVVGDTGPGTGGPDNDWVVSGADMYSAVPGHVGIGTSVVGLNVITGAYGDLGHTTGVYGECPGGYAGYFQGAVQVTGRLTKGSGSFKIDHPLDPENKYLQHSFVESPEMMNIYNGTVALDADGAATVELPDWFEALNRDFRYQLTCIGGFAPVYVAEKISENRFKIAGGQAGMEVSWQVTGVRQDPYANQYRVAVELDKSAQERGYYLHAAAYGLSQDKSIEAVRNPQRLKTREVAKRRAALAKSR